MKRHDAIHREFRGFHFIQKEGGYWDVYDHNPEPDFYRAPVSFRHKTLRSAQRWVSFKLFSDRKAA